MPAVGEMSTSGGQNKIWAWSGRSGFAPALSRLVAGRVTNSPHPLVDADDSQYSTDVRVRQNVRAVVCSDRDAILAISAA